MSAETRPGMGADASVATVMAVGASAAVEVGLEYPLAALVDQEQLKMALLLCAVNPGIGGVLIRGEKGSAKSTAARGLRVVMAPIQRVTGCRFNCLPGQPAEACDVCLPAKPAERSRAVANGAVLPMATGSERELTAPIEQMPVPFVDLPLGATEDRVLGSLDFERALKEGRRAFQPGLLAAAHRGILYIDEVNLLPDHLVDVLLDTAAMGVNRVQRDGLSIQHPARIALVGTMNQEEGELRPQLLDRFGMMVEVSAPREPARRAEIVRRRLAWETDPVAFNQRWQVAQSELRAKIVRAQTLLPRVSLAEGLITLISELCCGQGVSSLRADLVMNKVVRAMAALDGRSSVGLEDIERAAPLVLAHRRRARPFQHPDLDRQQLDELMKRARDHRAREPDDGHGDGADAPRGAEKSDAESPCDSDTQGTGASEGDAMASPDHRVAPEGVGAASNGSAGQAPAPAQVFLPTAGAAPPRIQVLPSNATDSPGRRSSAVQSRRGAATRAVLNEKPSELAVTATLQHSVIRNGGLSAAGELDVARQDLHQKVRSGRQGSLILFVVDASGSMAAMKRMEAVKGAVLSLLQDAYQRRDEVGVIAFRGDRAEVVLAPTRSVDVAELQLRDLPTGGRTPLADALRVASELLRSQAGKAGDDTRLEPLLIVLSDGKANAPLDDTGDPWQQSLEWAQVLGKGGVASIVLDTEAGFVRLGLAKQLAGALEAQYISLDQLDAQSVSVTVRGGLQRRAKRRLP